MQERTPLQEELLKVYKPEDNKGKIRKTPTREQVNLYIKDQQRKNKK